MVVSGRRLFIVKSKKQLMMADSRLAKYFFLFELRMSAVFYCNHRTRPAPIRGDIIRTWEWKLRKLKALLDATGLTKVGVFFSPGY